MRRTGPEPSGQVGIGEGVGHERDCVGETGFDVEEARLEIRVAAIEKQHAGPVESSDIGSWDNRSTQHAVVGDFGTQHGLIQRVTLKGDQPA